MMVESDALVRDYLGRLEVAAKVLPTDRRRELQAEIGEHIDAALAEATNRDEVAVRNVLERLGEPEDIVAAEAGPTATGTTSRAGALEIGALVLLASGSLLTPVFGVPAIVVSIVGLVLVWVSSAWTARQKTTATVILFGVLLLSILALRGGS